MAATERSYLTGREWMRVLLLVTTMAVVLAAGVGSASAQSFQQDINKTFGGPDFDIATSVVETSDGFALAGETDSFDASNGTWLIKTDSEGNELFNKTFGAPDSGASSVIETSDGGFAIAGGTNASFDAKSGDAFLIKTDSNGDVVFNKTFGGPNLDSAESVIETPGGFALAGDTESFGGSDEDAWLIKTDENGKELFNKTFGGQSRDNAVSVIETSGGGFALSGSARSFGGSSSDIWLIKTDSGGNEQFNKTFGGDFIDLGGPVIETSDGGFAITGQTESFGASSLDALLLKTDSDGNVEFNETFGGPETDAGSSLIETSDGGFAIAGFFNTDGNADAWLVGTDSQGDERINQTFGGVDFDEALSLVETTDGFALAGDTGSFGAGGFDAWLLKVSPQEDLFTRPLIDSFGAPPTNTQGLDNTLYEDLSGDGDGLGTTQTVRVFGQLIRGNALNGDAQDGSLTDEQARALNWNSGSPETEVTPADMVSLFGEQIRVP